MIPAYDYEMCVSSKLQELRRKVVADQLAAKGWDRNTHKFDAVVRAKVRKVRYLQHCRYDALIDPVLLRKVMAEVEAKRTQRAERMTRNLRNF